MPARGKKCNNAKSRGWSVFCLNTPGMLYQRVDGEESQAPPEKTSIRYSAPEQNSENCTKGVFKYRGSESSTKVLVVVINMFLMLTRKNVGTDRSILCMAIILLLCSYEANSRSLMEFRVLY
jgi:hypothetical protein